MKLFFTDYLKLIKSGITVFALISACAGYVLAVSPAFSWISASLFIPVLLLLAGLYLVVSGGFILNQVYERKLDGQMQRTRNRPLPAGRITKLQALALGITHIIIGLLILLALNPLTAGLAFLAIVLYNFFYTVLWKTKWTFAAVPGALPGALPAVIGYSAGANNIFSIECLYLFFILFLWQMPHFWSLAVGYCEDYKKAGVPVLPAHLGVQKTFYHISFYLLSYLGLALISPLFFKMNIVYIFCLVPFCIKVLKEFLKFSRENNWKPFFIWLNFSILVFLWAPAVDIWIYSKLFLN